MNWDEKTDFFYLIGAGKVVRIHVVIKVFKK